MIPLQAELRFPEVLKSTINQYINIKMSKPAPTQTPQKLDVLPKKKR